MNVYLGGTLPLTRSFYECLFKKEFAAHDVLEDVTAHRKIFLGPEIDINTETLINGCGIHTV
jgi:hypothetical protein